MRIIVLHLLHAIVIMAQHVAPLRQVVLVLQLILPEVVVAYIAGNVKHPRSEVAIAAEQMTILYDAEEGVLHQVFTGLPVAMLAGGRQVGIRSRRRMSARMRLGKQ